MISIVRREEAYTEKSNTVHRIQPGCARSTIAGVLAAAARFSNCSAKEHHHEHEPFAREEERNTSKFSCDGRQLT